MIAGVVALFATAPLAAQAGQVGPCMRISFGPWTPPLDWNRAGHADSVDRIGAHLRNARDSLYSGQASIGGRDEMQWDESGGVRRLILSPMWWPAGVIITFRGPDADGMLADTLMGTAVALVADGTRSPSRSEARVLRGHCPARAP